MDTSGFYNPDFLLRAGLFVYGPDYTLLKSLKDTYTYPVHGWTWFDSAEAAVEFYHIPIEEWNLDLPQQE